MMGPVLMGLLVLSAWQAAPGADQPAPWETWQPPAVTLPNPNGYDTYLRAFDLKRHIDRVNHLPWPPGAPPAADSWGEGPPDRSLPERVALYAEVLGMVREALSQPCRLPPPDVFGDDLLPFYSGFQTVARLLAMESAAHVEEGHFAAAAESGSDCIDMAHDVATRRTLIAFLAGNSIERTGAVAVDAAVPNLGATECRGLLERLARGEAKRIALAEVVDGQERMARIEFKFLVRFCGGTHPPAELATGPAAWATGVDQTTWRDSWPRLGPYFTALRQCAEEPSYSARKPAIAPDPLVELVAGPMSRLWFRDARDRAMSRLRIALVAARAYTLEQHRLPAGLADLVPGYLGSVPVDPFGDGPLKSKLTADALLIYSIGPDGKDDGGTPIKGYLREDSVGDIVVTVPKG